MDRLFSFVGDLADPVKGGGDTFVDRLNCRYTPCILLIFALIITTKQYVGEPIACWCPDHFTHAQIDYTNQVCWVFNTYYLPHNESIPHRGEPRNTIGYYQWVSLLLCTMAVMFYLPRILWTALNTKSGIAVTSITDAAIEYQRNTDNMSRGRNMSFMKKQMGNFLKELSGLIKQTGKAKTFFYKLRYSNYLVAALLFCKVCYMFNIVGQIMMLNLFLQTTYTLYGFDILERVFSGKSLSDSRRFPRVTMCDMEIRVLGNVQPYTVMCALPVNLFNEMAFIFVWFWLAIMGLCTLASFMYWLMVGVLVPHQTKFVKTRLIAMGKLGSSPSHMVRSFVRNYLRNDGMIIIELVSENSSDLIAAELICALWDLYREKIEAVKKAENRTRGSVRKKPNKNSGYETDTDTEGDVNDNKPRKKYFGHFLTVDQPTSEEPEADDDDDQFRGDDDDEEEEYHDDDDEDRPPIPPKPSREDMDMRLRMQGKDAEKLRKEKLLKLKRERELREHRRGDRKHLRAGYRQ